MPKKTTKTTSKKTTKKTTKKESSTSGSSGIEAGDFIRVEFTGRVKDTGSVFATSNEDNAKKFDIYDSKSKYGPIPIVAGQSFLLPGLDKQIIGLEVGKEQTLTVPSEEAYGPRKNELIQTFPVRKLKASGIKPKKGEKIRNKDQTGVIIGVKNGRAKVDFNHEFAGLDLEFDIEVVEKIEEESKKLFFMVSRYIAALKEEDFSYEANKDDKSISLSLSPFLLLTEGLQNVTLRIISDVRQNFGYEKIEFKFAFDFSDIAKEEKKLADVLDGSKPTESETSDEDETEEKATEAEIEN